MRIFYPGGRRNGPSGLGLASFKAGDKVEVTVLRGGRTISLSTILPD